MDKLNMIVSETMDIIDRIVVLRYNMTIKECLGKE
jgi:hypothetical protein